MIRINIITTQKINTQDLLIAENIKATNYIEVIRVDATITIIAEKNM